MLKEDPNLFRWTTTTKKRHSILIFFHFLCTRFPSFTLHFPLLSILCRVSLCFFLVHTLIFTLVPFSFLCLPALLKGLQYLLLDLPLLRFPKNITIFAYVSSTLSLHPVFVSPSVSIQLADISVCLNTTCNGYRELISNGATL